MKSSFLKKSVIIATFFFLLMACNKEPNNYDQGLNRENRVAVFNTNKLVQPNTVINIYVSVNYYDNINGGTIDISWTGASSYWNITISGAPATFYYVYGNSFSYQKHVAANTTITVTVKSTDETQSGTGTCFVSQTGGQNPNLFNPLPPFSSMDITSDLGGCTMNLSWPMPSYNGTAYFYLELRSPINPGSDGSWHNIVLAQCYSSTGYISIHINRYYFNDPVINARLVIQNQPFPNDVAITPPPVPNPANGGPFNLYFTLPSTSYHFSGTINEFPRAINTPF